VDPDKLKQEIAKYKWFHTIDFGNGVVTSGVDDTPRKLKSIGLPDDLRGMTVLDIGAADGFFSFEAERRGAARVLATDLPVPGIRGLGERFALAREALGCSKVQDLGMEVYELSIKNVGVFDVVLFLGVLYHLKHPLLALERVRSVTGRMLILETHVDMCDYQRPAAAFYPKAELNNDPSNWWGPNEAAVVGMLETAGFADVKVFSRNMFSRRTGRMVFHARPSRTAPITYA
jgi:tRNA (mo5U34)-methyltransferase